MSGTYLIIFGLFCMQLVILEQLCASYEVSGEDKRLKRSVLFHPNFSVYPSLFVAQHTVNTKA